VGDQLGDPEWDKREVRLAMIRLRGHIRHEYADKAKILAWHANQMRSEVARLRTDYPKAVRRWRPSSPRLRWRRWSRAEQLEARVWALPIRKHRHS
jgi:hypothetical protein